MQVRRGGDPAVAGEADGRALSTTRLPSRRCGSVEEDAEHALAVVEDERIAREDLGRGEDHAAAAGAWTTVPGGTR